MKFIEVETVNGLRMLVNVGDICSVREHEESNHKCVLNLSTGESVTVRKPYKWVRDAISQVCKSAIMP